MNCNCKPRGASKLTLEGAEPPLTGKRCTPCDCDFVFPFILISMIVFMFLSRNRRSV